MAKITRVLQKIFGVNSAATERSEIGSLAEGTPATTSDALVMQARPAFEGGWPDCVLGGNSTAIEDRNALDFLLSRQIAYLMQMGISEWDATTTYYIGSIVIDASGIMFRSLIDTNLNKPLGNNLEWEGVSFVLDKMATTSKEALSNFSMRSFTSVASSQNNNWNGMVWAKGLGLFVAVSSDGANRVTTSPDGITWTNRVAALASFWTAVAWSESLSLLCAVCLDGGALRVQTSPDGITWTARTDNGFNLWVDVIWSEELALFVAISTSGVDNVMTSPDGITWTLETESQVNNWNAITWSKELGILLAVGSGGGATPVCMTSPDGAAWTNQANLPQAQGWNSVVWSACLKMFAAVAGSGANRVATSPDGVTWTLRVSADDTNNWSKIIWCDQLGAFIATSNVHASAEHTMISNNGIDWRFSPSTVGTGQGWVAMAWSEKLSRLSKLPKAGGANALYSDL